MLLRDIHDDARGRWRSILPALGVPARFLVDQHGPCPCCGGRDRFRFDDQEGKGTFFCNGCGAGTGIDLVMKINKIDFREASRRVRGLCGSAPIEIRKASHREGRGNISAAIWGASHPLTGFDVASRYLRNRGIRLTSFPAMLRFHPAALYTHADKSKSRHPALVAKFVSADAQASTIHMTFLTPEGQKADLDPCRKLAPGSIPLGGAVRLSNSAETMGIAEGIETALSASVLFELPVWSALTSGAMTRWEPPQHVRHVLIFADNDASFTGQSAAYQLAHRLKAEGKIVEVRLPDIIDTDWNDLIDCQSADMSGSLRSMAREMRSKPVEIAEAAE
jgi:putative DNA primase/helicase